MIGKLLYGRAVGIPSFLSSSVACVCVAEGDTYIPLFVVFIQRVHDVDDEL